MRFTRLPLLEADDSFDATEGAIGACTDGLGAGEAPASPQEEDTGSLSLQTTPDSDDDRSEYLEPIHMRTLRSATLLSADASSSKKSASLPYGVSSSTVLAGGALPSSSRNEVVEDDIGIEEDEDVNCRKKKRKTTDTSGCPGSSKLDDFTRLLIQDDARMLIDLLKLAVTGTACLHGEDENI